MAEFRREVHRAYRAFTRRPDSAGQLRTIYVQISELRDIVLSFFGLTRLEDRKTFDKMFRALLDSPEGRDFHLYGAAPQWFTDKTDQALDQNAFTYKGKIYVFMSIS
jgi:hypothetical protein